MTDKTVPDELMKVARKAGDAYEADTPLADANWRGHVRAILAAVVAKVRADERAKVAEEIRTLWPDTFGAWNADQAYAAQTTKEQILKRVTRGEQ